MRADLSKKMITVFTPTYNRAYIIGKLYESLKRQTFKDFEWLVIDDGSVDNTENLIQGFILENEIEIRYIKKDNGGQHTALNKAIECAKGHLLMIVDSDDYLTDTALERILYWENTIAEKEGYAGISGLRAFPWGDTIGGKWKQKENYVDATNLERKKYRLRGDKAEAYYTNVLRQYYPIPVFAGENDVEKGVLWNRIANGGYKLRWFNERIYICEYLDDGMSKNIVANHLKNFQGYTCWRRELIDMQKSYWGVIRELSEFTYKARLKGYNTCQVGELVDRKLLTVCFAKIYYKLHQLKIRVKRGRLQIVSHLKLDRK